MIKKPPISKGRRSKISTLRKKGSKLSTLTRGGSKLLSIRG